MRKLARFSLLLVLVLVVVSAYLRLHQSGIGCPDFPTCYAQIGNAPETQPISSQSAYERIVAESDAPLAWASPLHRAVASLLGLCVLALVFLSFRNKQFRLLSLSLLVITVFLAMIGLRSGGLHHPAIVMGNLLGGFLMVGLLGWMVFNINRSAMQATVAKAGTTRPVLCLALFLLCLQITLGGLTSANFAATACTTFPSCNSQWLPDASVVEALQIFEAHQINDFGQAVGGMERVSIHIVHRMGAMLAALTIILAGLMSIKSTPGWRILGLTAIGLVLLEFGVGVASVLTELPISLAVAHNWLAAMLLLVLLKMLALTRKPLL